MLIEKHPQMRLVFATAESQRGEAIHIGGRELTFIGTEEARLGEADLLFSALPHGTSEPWVRRARAEGTKVVDLSSDFRPGNRTTSKKIDRVPYGLTELCRKEIEGADLVANPGCYPTAILLALAPVLSMDMLEEGSMIAVTAASGVTGAGYSARPELLFAEISEDFRAYAAGNVHRHLLEMNAFLTSHGGSCDLVFTPHLLPVARGILATIVVRLKHELEEVLEPWRQVYATESFVEVSETTPALRDVVRRNVVRISAVASANTKTPTLVITAAIDNLMKGAAGQAVQNANLMLGIDETLGLPA